MFSTKNNFSLSQTFFLTVKVRFICVFKSIPRSILRVGRSNNEVKVDEGQYAHDIASDNEGKVLRPVKKWRDQMVCLSHLAWNLLHLKKTIFMWCGVSKTKPSRYSLTLELLILLFLIKIKYVVYLIVSEHLLNRYPKTWKREISSRVMQNRENLLRKNIIVQKFIK